MMQKNQNQLGFTFEVEADILTTSVVEEEDVCQDCHGGMNICSNVACPRYTAPEPEQTFLMPEFEEEAKERAAAAEDDLPWEEYTSQAQLLFFDQNGRQEYKELLSRAAVSMGTQNATDTILEALRRVSH
jgi:hypothetical protein